MGNCLAILGFKKLKRPVTLLLVGLDNAGKTTAAKGIVGESIENVAPTVGFCPETIEYRGCEITIFDLGGGTRIRAVWSKYFSEVHGIIFVIDSSDKSRVEECHTVLRNLLSHTNISGKPVLILANKQDVEGALDEIDLVESLKIEEIVNTYKCPARVETCSAITIKNKKPEKAIADGFRWLIDTIVLHYTDLEKRVARDVGMESVKQKVEMDKRRERLKRLREEQERREELARIEAIEAIEDDVDNSDEDVIIIEKIGKKKFTTKLVTSSNILNDEGTIYKESNEDSPNTSSDAQELIELGLTTPNLLSASPSSSSSSKSSISVSLTTRKVSKLPPSSEVLKSPQLILVQSSPKQSSTQCEGKSADPNSQLTNSLLNVRSLIDVHSSYTELDSSQEERRHSKECIPIDSDDEMFANIKIPDILSNTSPNFSNGSITLGIKAQLELEASLSHKPKKKTFLKRLHKTAPMNSSSNGLVSVASSEASFISPTIVN